jgi:hypothetical protein
VSGKVFSYDLGYAVAASIFVAVWVGTILVIWRWDLSVLEGERTDRKKGVGLICAASNRFVFLVIWFRVNGLCPETRALRI